MARCKDGRKHIIVKEYEKKEGTKVSKHERSCPTRESRASIDLYICHVCGKEYNLRDIHKIEIKGKVRNICKNCSDTFHVLT